MKGEVSEPKNPKEINGYLLVEVPEKTETDMFFLHFGNLYTNVKYERTRFYKKLPKGNYSIIGLAKDLTKEQWREIVEFENRIARGYKDYEVLGRLYATATASGHSLLKVNNLNPNTTLILKKSL